jgi:hypothetical protein
MIKIDSLAAQYWIDNTDRIYAEELHVSTPVMDAYRAGFMAALFLAQRKIDRVSTKKELNALDVTLIADEED